MKAFNISNQGKTLPIMEEFYSLQGEGHHTGKAAYFLRIGGCDVGCSFCDVKESWNPDLHPLVAVDDVIKHISETKADTVVVTGGEPCLYNLSYLCEQLSKQGLVRHLETSGSEPLSGQWDWICLSPKKGTYIHPVFYTLANELKVIIQDSSDIARAEENASCMHHHSDLFLQPEWSKRGKVMPLIVDYILQHPQWKISLQSHKYMRIP